MKFRSAAMVMIFSLLAIFGSVVQAQDDDVDVDLCFNLSEADCEVFNAAGDNQLGDVQSARANLTLSLVATDVPVDEEGGLFVTTTLDIDGFIDFIAGEDTGNVTDLNFENAQGVFTVSGMTEGGTDEGVLEPTELEFRVVDDIFYWFAEPNGEWRSLDLNAARDDESFGEDFVPGGIGGGDSDDADALFDTSNLEEIADTLVDIDGLFNHVRVGDTFTLTIDLQAMEILLEEDFEDELDLILDRVAEVDPTTAFLLPAVPALISEGTIVIEQRLNPERNIFEFTALTLTFNAELADLLLGISNEDPVVVNFNLTTSLEMFDTIAMATVPDAEVTVIEPADFFDNIIDDE